MTAYFINEMHLVPIFKLSSPPSDCLGSIQWPHPADVEKLNSAQVVTHPNRRKSSADSTANMGLLVNALTS